MKSKSLLAYTLVATFALPPMATAQDSKPSLKALRFEAAANNLTPSSQRFEYRLENPKILQVGDIRINTDQIKMTFSQSSGQTDVSLQWPHSLFEEGEISIVDSAGKALARKSFTAQDLFLPTDQELTEEDLVRTALSQLQWHNLPKDLLSRLRQTAFFRFCLYRQDGDTSTTLCSPESFFKKGSASLEVGTRAPYREARIEINNEVVGKQGIIYLNDVNESVRFHAETENGAFLELNTRSKKVDFEDIVTLSDGSRLVITAKGAEPIDPRRIRRLEENRWQTSLSTQRPILFMRGEGGIPLRQDFQVKGPLPQSSDRIYVDKSTPEYVYSANLIISGSNPDRLPLKINSADRRSLLNVQGDKFTWNLQSLTPNTLNRYELSLGDKNFTAHYDVYRGLPRSLDGGLSYDTVNDLSLGADLRWWFEDFLFLNSGFSKLRWGAGLTYQKSFEEAQKRNHLHGRLYWRARPGLQRSQNTWGLLTDYWNVNAVDSNTSLLGLGVFSSTQPPRVFAKWMDWFEVEGVVHALSLDSSSNMERVLNLNAKGFMALRHDWSFHYGLGFSYYKLKEGNIDPHFTAETGISWVF